MKTKFNILYQQIMNISQNQQKKILFNNKILLVGHLFAPKIPFEITEQNYISGALCKGKDTYAGRVKQILSNNEIIYEITGNYSEKMVPSLEDLNTSVIHGYNSFRGPSVTIKYRLIPNETYYICDKNNPPYQTGKWQQVIFKNQ